MRKYEYLSLSECNIYTMYERDEMTIISSIVDKRIHVYVFESYDRMKAKGEKPIYRYGDSKRRKTELTSNRGLGRMVKRKYSTLR